MKQLVLATLGLVMAAGAAQAQFGMPFQRPSTSPSFRPSSNPFVPGSGAFGTGSGSSPLTRQQQDALRYLGQVQTGQAGGQLAALPSLGVTGHPVTFFNYSHYYTFPSPRFGPGSSGARPNANNLAGPGREFGLAAPPPGIGILVNAPIRTGE